MLNTKALQRATDVALAKYEKSADLLEGAVASHAALSDLIAAVEDEIKRHHADALKFGERFSDLFDRLNQINPQADEASEGGA